MQKISIELKVSETSGKKELSIICEDTGTGKELSYRDVIALLEMAKFQILKAEIIED